MVTHLTVEQRQLALRLKARGLSLREIGPQVGCSHELVRLIARGILSPPKDGGEPRRFDGYCKHHQQQEALTKFLSGSRHRPDTEGRSISAKRTSDLYQLERMCRTQQPCSHNHLGDNMSETGTVRPQHGQLALIA